MFWLSSCVLQANADYLNAKALWEQRHARSGDSVADTAQNESHINETNSRGDASYVVCFLVIHTGKQNRHVPPRSQTAIAQTLQSKHKKGNRKKESKKTQRQSKAKQREATRSNAKHHKAEQGKKKNKTKDKEEPENRKQQKPKAT